MNVTEIVLKCTVIRQKRDMATDGTTETLLLKQGAESKIHVGTFLGRPAVIKERFPKMYRHPVLDANLTKERLKAELRVLTKCRQIGIRTPSVYFVDLDKNAIIMEYVEKATTLREHIQKVQGGDSYTHESLQPLMRKIGEIIGTLHSNNVIHGDLTTSNFLILYPVEETNLVLIDFGLSYIESSAEDKGVDLYVLERAFLSTHPNTEMLFSCIINAYKQTNKKGASEVMHKFEEVRLRGRKRTMVG